ncbi:MAG TPA: FAD-dependent oxidoreductase [Bryobacteraceae bacterium]
MVNTDIAVIGGGPAGLAAAIAARRKSFRVTVYDPIVPPADKACGEGLMPDGLAALARVGVRIGDADSFPFRGIRFVDRGVSVAADFPAGPGRGVRRTTLHRLLAEHAEAAGVELRWGTRVDLDGLKCGWTIGADGGNSRVRKWAGLDRGMRERWRFGFRRHYRVEPWGEHVEIYWGAGYQLYITPVTTDSVCVAAISRDSRLRLDEALGGFPELCRRLKRGGVIGDDRGGVSASRRLETVCRGRVALVGDASGSVDAITGEGLCLAFQHAVAVVEAIAAGDLAGYARKHREMARRPEWMGKVLVTLGEHAGLRRAAMRALRAQPRIFAKLLAVHVGAVYEMESSTFAGCFAGFGDGVVWAGDGGRIRSGPDSGEVHAQCHASHCERIVPTDAREGAL